MEKIRPYYTGAENEDGYLLPSNQAYYGPYATKEEAWAYITSQMDEENIPAGLTVGIGEDDSIEEYWFSGGITFSDLVSKHGGVGSVRVTQNATDATISVHNNYGNSATPATIGLATAQKAGLFSPLEKENLATVYGNMNNAVNSIEFSGTARGEMCLQYSTIGSMRPESVEVPIASDTYPGFMSSDHKSQLDAAQEAISDISVQVEAGDYIEINTTKVSGESGDSVELPAATQSKAGLMSAADKTKLDTMTPGMTDDERNQLNATYNADIINYIKAETSESISISGRKRDGGINDTFVLNSATTATAGLMSAEDKALLTSLTPETAILAEKLTSEQYYERQRAGSLNSNILYVITNG